MSGRASRWAAKRRSAPIDGAQLRAYPGAPHGIADTHKEQLGADLLEFLNATNERPADEPCHVHA